MTHASFLKPHLTRAFTGPTWHGSSLAELLADVSAREAETRPHPELHTIAELVGHIRVWTRAAEQRLNGEPGSPTEAEQWPAIDTSSDEAWAGEIKSVLDQHESLARAFAGVDEAQLHARLPGREHGAAILVHGIVEHDAYHGGQIALVKKLVRASR